MQTGNLSINDEGRVIIEDRVFYRLSDRKDGIIENTDTGEKGVLRSCEEYENIEKLDSFESDVFFAICTMSGAKNIIFPRIFKTDEDGKTLYYMFTEIPKGYAVGTQQSLEEAVEAGNFYIHSRVRAAISLCETFYALKDYLGSNILTIHPETIFINVETGEVSVWIEKWLSEKGDRCDLAAIQRFLSYYMFRMLCAEDPFDGRKTLLEYPLLTDEAKKEISCGKYGFSLVNGENVVTGYIGKNKLNRWKGLPAFIRNLFEYSFTTGLSDEAKKTDIEQWLDYTRRLRDCLVLVNGQFKFCDPDGQNQVPFMVVGDYKIPVWPQKAIYSYHVGLFDFDGNHTVLAGVTARNGKCYLLNRSDETWGVLLDNTNSWIHPGTEVEICVGMQITMENGKTIQIVSGSEPVTTGAASASGAAPIADTPASDDLLSDKDENDPENNAVISHAEKEGEATDE